MIVISSCLAGKKCRYDGTDCLNADLLKELNMYIEICPELLAGFAIPRTPCEIVGGEGADVINGTAKIIDINGIDITKEMLSGAKQAVALSQKKGVTKAYLKKRSPTCGCGTIYDGSFTSTLKSGNGIFTELLRINNIQVIEK